MSHRESAMMSVEQHLDIDPACRVVSASLTCVLTRSQRQVPARFLYPGANSSDYPDFLLGASGSKTLTIRSAGLPSQSEGIQRPFGCRRERRLLLDPTRIS